MKLVLSKYLAMLIYFVGLLAITLIILFLQRHSQMPWEKILNMVVFFAYIQALVLLLSSLLKERLSTFVGIVIGFAFPILGSVTALHHGFFYQLLAWLLPFRYLDARWEILVLGAITLIILGATLYIFQKREV